jgi:hypothetical protein
MASKPDSSADFQRCGNIVGAAGIVMPEVLHSTKSPARISARVAITRPRTREIVNLPLPAVRAGSTVVNVLRVRVITRPDAER